VIQNLKWTYVGPFYQGSATCLIGVGGGVFATYGPGESLHIWFRVPLRDGFARNQPTWIGQKMIEHRPEVDLRLAELKRSGTYPVYAIKAIRDEFGMALDEAKMRFSQSSAWAAEQAASARLHQQILDALGDEGIA
jgi:hypothetical protein